MKDLIQLYKFYSPHGTEGETQICDWLVERFKQLGSGIQVERKGNTIWHFEKGNQYLLSAHLDQVATNGPAVHFFKSDKGIIRAYNKDWQRTSLGADDKNGVWCILKLAEAGKNFDFIISEGEEVGCAGINAIEEHIKESTAKIGIVIDRKSNTDILKGGSTDVYCDTLAGCLRNFWNNECQGNNYEVTTGSISDTRVICKYMESVNLCANYEDAHTKNETTDWEGLQRTRRNLEFMFNGFKHYPSKPEVYVKKDYSTYYYKNYKKKSSTLEDLFEDEYYKGGHYGRY